MVLSSPQRPSKKDIYFWLQKCFRPGCGPLKPNLRKALANLAWRFLILKAMSATVRPRRTCLSMPASSPKMLAKGATLAVDEVFMDLEDSVAPDAKEAAREHMVTALHEVDYGHRTVVVRVNAVDSPWHLRDVEAVVTRGGDAPVAIMVPKIESAEEVAYLDRLITAFEYEVGRQTPLGLEVQVETAKGLTKVHEIASASERIETLVFGPGDMAASLGMASLTQGARVGNYPGDPFHYAMHHLLVAARAHGLGVIDGPYAGINDPEGLEVVSKMAAALGYDGKWCLHPNQVDIINEAFTPAQEDFDQAKHLLSVYEQSTSGDAKGAIRHGEIMVDEASAKMAQGIIQRGQAAGLA